MKMWVVVYSYGMIIEDVGLFLSLEEAKRGFKEYTGFNYNEERKWMDFGGEEYSEEYGGCDIFKKDLDI